MSIIVLAMNPRRRMVIVIAIRLLIKQATQRQSYSQKESLPRSTFSKGLPLPKTIFSPACLKASVAVHSAA